MYPMSCCFPNLLSSLRMAHRGEDRQTDRSNTKCRREVGDEDAIDGRRVDS